MRTLIVRAHLGSAMVQIGVEIDGYSPDILDDLSNRVTVVMREMTQLAIESGVPMEEPALGIWRAPR